MSISSLSAGLTAKRVEQQMIRGQEAHQRGQRGQGTVVSNEFGPSMDDHAELPNKSF